MTKKVANRDPMDISGLGITAATFAAAVKVAFNSSIAGEHVLRRTNRDESHGAGLRAEGWHSAPTPDRHCVR